MDKSKPVTKWKSGLPETTCGRGSMLENTKEIRRIIPQVIEQYDIQDVADIGCGDQNWIWDCFPFDVFYTGYDVIPRRRAHEFDVRKQTLPCAYDLVLLIYVLNHMPPDEAENALQLVKDSGSKYLLMSYSSADQYAIPGELLQWWEHKTRYKGADEIEWNYGLWKL